MRTCDRQAGFTLLGLLFIVAGLGVAMAALGTVWHSHAQREKEAQLLFVGEQYARAIASYRRMGPGADQKAPPSLDVLLADPRFPNPVRHLRRAYRDPMTGKAEWGLARDEAGGILGVYSRSGGAPMKQAGFRAGREGFAEAETYRDWVFLAEVPAPSPGSASPGLALNRPPAAGRAATATP